MHRVHDRVRDRLARVGIGLHELGLGVEAVGEIRAPERRARAFFGAAVGEHDRVTIVDQRVDRGIEVDHRIELAPRCLLYTSPSPRDS